MDALTLLLTRHSQPRLTAPAPADEALENIKQAALRAPDHACLKPWKFIVCTGKGLDKLGDILQDSAISSDKEQVSIDRALQLPHRAP
ncbi:MAG: nitroreductase, partial [Glaciecola sp.]|nr:nitroreductase [Glaciecola sp.]